MTGVEKFFDLVDRGRKGQNIGLTIGSPKLETYMDGYLPGTSYLIGAESGVGKTSFALWAFIYQPLKEYLSGIKQERDPYWIMFSLEMTQPQIYAKLVSMYIFDTFGITLRFKDIFSRGKDCLLSDEHYELLQQCVEFMNILDERLIFFEGTLTPQIFEEKINEVIPQFGKFEGESFIPNNPSQIVGLFIDHLSLIPGKKEAIDAISRATVTIRNVTGIVSPILIAQFNRDNANMERLKGGLQEPTKNDFKDSGSPYEDSSVCLALFSPHSHKLSTYRKYDIKILEQCLISVTLLKSRFGSSDIVVPFNFFGDITHYIEMPKPDEIYDYSKYTNPNYLLEDNLEFTDENNNLDPNSNFNFIL